MPHLKPSTICSMDPFFSQSSNEVDAEAEAEAEAEAVLSVLAVLSNVAWRVISQS